MLPRQRITAALADAVAAYPLTVLTAPMGYGKTTAARALASVASKEFFFVSIPPGPHTALYLWDLTFGQLAVQGLEIAVPLQQMGFPTDVPHMHRVLEVCRSFKSSVLLVLDDYHFATDPHMDAFIEALVREDLPDFNILLLSRTRPNMALEDMRVKGLATVFGQDLLAFSQHEAVAYFQLNNMFDAAIAENAWQFSEGWAAALWLSLQSWHRH